MLGSSLRELSLKRHGRRKRASSYDRGGGNKDFIIVEPGGSGVMADIKGTEKNPYLDDECFT